VNQAVVADLAKNERRFPTALNEELKNRELREQRRFTKQARINAMLSRNSLKGIARYWNNNKKSIVLGAAKRVTKLD